MRRFRLLRISNTVSPRRLGLSVAALALSVGGFSKPANAYVLEGKSWPSGSIVLMQLTVFWNVWSTDPFLIHGLMT